MAFLHLCQATGLDPFRREIYLIPYNDSKAPGGKRWIAQTGIDGYRRLAQNSGEFAGRTEPQWCGPDGVWRDVWLDPENPPTAARVGVRRDGHVDPTYAVALFREYVPMKPVWRNGAKVRDEHGAEVQEPSAMWKKMPALMIAKVAEAQALRAAFPRQTSGLYVTEEMERTSADSSNTPEAAAEARQRAYAEAKGEPVEETVDAEIVDAEIVDTTPAPEAPEPEAEVEPVDVVDAEVVPETPATEPVTTDLDRAGLLSELDAQATAMNVKTAALTRRWVASRRKNVEDATDAELADLVRSLRPIVATKLRTDGLDVLADGYGNDTSPVVNLAALLDAELAA
jgi:phage recombination protein Bet